MSRVFQVRCFDNMVMAEFNELQDARRYYDHNFNKFQNTNIRIEVFDKKLNRIINLDDERLLNAIRKKINNEIKNKK
jgi:hypothetical protein